MNFIESNARLQLWGGLECSVNRIEDEYSDQIIRTGHHLRDDDVDTIAGLGFDALRYPVLWERAVDARSKCFHWEWADRRLSLLRKHSIPVILGLVHHGSGPLSTNLLEDSFVDGLADYAAAVAKRYPWANAYTPINEPLTTARFSALYGHWYPHKRSDEAFATALLNECLASLRAMSAIRKINPEAKFVLTEDLAKIHSTPLLSDQASFENTRRWLSIDLLLGRVDRHHPLWKYLARSNRLIDKLNSLEDLACDPDLLGFNYYVTSERYLDERIELYPEWTHGGNSHLRYADVEAVRVREENFDGVENLLSEAWERYGLPMAVTEVHLGGQREQQILWVLECWNACHRLRARDIDVRAMTIWNLFGSYDWNTLCTKRNENYESGVFDVSSGVPRPTALANVVKHLNRKQTTDFSYCLPKKGWWERPSRLVYNVSSILHDSPTEEAATINDSPRPILILCKSATLARAFSMCCASRDLPYRTLNVGELLANPGLIESHLRDHTPWAVINAMCIGESCPLSDENECSLEDELNLVETTAQTCKKLGAALLNLSSHKVFDPILCKSFSESDDTCPPCDLGRRFKLMESIVKSVQDESLIIRAGLLVNDWLDPLESYNYSGILSPHHFESVVVDSPSSFTYVPDLIDVCINMLFDSQVGIWHLVNQQPIHDSSTDSSKPLLRRSSNDDDQVNSEACELVLRSSLLKSERGQLLPQRTHLFNRYLRISDHQMIVD